MAGIIDARLDLDQAIQVNPVHICPTVLARDSTPPRVTELGPLNDPQEVDSIRWQANLQNLLRLIDDEEIRASEVGKGQIGTPEVPRGRIDPQVHVLGVAGPGVVDKCQATDHQIPHLVLAQQPQEILKVWDRVHAQDSHAKALLRPLTRRMSSRMATSAESRASGVWLSQNSRSHRSASAKFFALCTTIRRRRKTERCRSVIDK
jgi:hypothetical protein